MFVPQRQETPGRRTVVSHVSGTASVEVDDDRKRCRPGIPATGHQPGKPAQVRECTGKPGRRAYMKLLRRTNPMQAGK